jgi:hypothetical protein
MHAGWNLFLKKSQDRLVTMATLHLVSGVIGIAAVPFLPTPYPESWPYIFASVVLSRKKRYCSNSDNTTDKMQCCHCYQTILAFFKKQIPASVHERRK